MNLPYDLELDAGARAISQVTQEIPVGTPASLPPQIPLVPGYVEADARVRWQVFPATSIELAGFNLLHAQHLETNDSSSFTPHEIPRYFTLSLRQRF